MLSTETRAAAANLNAKLDFNIKLTVQEKLLLLSAIRANIKNQLDMAETFHGEHYASSSFENVDSCTSKSTFFDNVTADSLKTVSVQ